MYLLLCSREGFLYSDFPYPRKFSEKCLLSFTQEYLEQQVCRKCYDGLVDPETVLDVLEEVVEAKLIMGEGEEGETQIYLRTF